MMSIGSEATAHSMSTICAGIKYAGGGGGGIHLLLGLERQRYQRMLQIFLVTSQSTVPCLGFYFLICYKLKCMDYRQSVTASCFMKYYI
jgi:hypothetical protein